jgi:alkaline phosphatase D
VRVELGPVLGAVTMNSARVWVRTAVPADVTLQIAKDSPDRGWIESVAVRSSHESDLAAIVELDSLEADTCYLYRVRTSGIPATREHRFCTFPQQAETVTLGFLADLDKRDWYPAPAISALASRAPDILVILGDWDHRDPVADSEIRQMHRENRSHSKHAGQLMTRHFLGTTPVAYVWDDHDYGENNSNRFSPLKETALAAYRDYWPSYPLESDDGIWHKFSYADIAEIFMLDVRSQRDLQSYMDPRFVPDGQPGGNRGTLRRDPARSMLDGAAKPEGQGTGQKSWLLESLRTSRHPWKIIVSPVTWNSTTVKDDAWWDYLAERNEILSFVRAHEITGVMVVSADIHTGGGIDDGSNADLPEMTIPAVNLNETPLGRPTCAIYPQPNRSIATSCGAWSEGLSRHGSGYGVIRLSRETAILETHNLLGESRVLILSSTGTH